ncbi:MAG: S-adenosylmethionine:tRNA ribosyltransferase-isomerase [Solirubrobacteraceae bacterium]
MSSLAFELTPAREAGEPPEARGLARDEVLMMVARRSRADLVHTRFHALADHLGPGDLLVINNSATLPAAVPARRDGAAIEVRFATRAPAAADADRVVVELRTADGASPLRAAAVGEQILLAGGARLELLAPYAASGRLYLARAEIASGLHRYLAVHGHPIRYGYVSRRWPLSAYQTAFAAVPGSAEMPSAGRPFTPELVARLVAGGTLIASLTLHTGVSSPERHEPPYPEPYAVPAATARLVNAVRGWGGRIVAVGTTVVRALETVAAPDGTVHAGSGWTYLVVSADRRVRAVDGLITGWHEPEASHLQMLEAIAGEALVRRCYDAALQRGYLWHEFGDSHLILP